MNLGVITATIFFERSRKNRFLIMPVVGHLNDTAHVKTMWVKPSFFFKTRFLKVPLDFLLT